ncbi:hypothetical protein [Burkholderia territorii]|uniref:hypothetical protein n=1 Tax=Burkholderia territorii TaxID=1503055 RepID=UPI00075D8116|nr:hypothetical protein [Burkholderia territorii]
MRNVSHQPILTMRTPVSISGIPGFAAAREERRRSAHFPVQCSHTETIQACWNGQDNSIDNPCATQVAIARMT